MFEAAQGAFQFFDPFFVFGGLFFQPDDVGFAAQRFDFGFDRAGVDLPFGPRGPAGPRSPRGPAGPVWAIRLIPEPIAALSTQTATTATMKKRRVIAIPPISAGFEARCPRGSVGFSTRPA